jgi:histidine triad (HIT) family protein
MNSLFSRIISGEIPSYKIAENDMFFAFLDINPLAKGHTLIVPKKEVDYFFDVDDGELEQMLPFAKEIAQKLKKVTQCARVGIAVIGFEVPHAHMHLIPMNDMSDIDFSRPKLKFSPNEFLTIAEAIRKA